MFEALIALAVTVAGGLTVAAVIGIVKFWSKRAGSSEDKGQSAHASTDAGEAAESQGQPGEGAEIERATLQHVKEYDPKHRRLVDAIRRGAQFVLFLAIGGASLGGAYLLSRTWGAAVVAVVAAVAAVVAVLAGGTVMCKKMPRDFKILIKKSEDSEEEATKKTSTLRTNKDRMRKE